jgi:arylsulfatase
MLTCDDDFAERAKGFIKKSTGDDKPFFVWVNFTHMHMFTHTKKESLGQVGRWQSPYHDTMVDHDRNVGSLIDYLDELGIAEDTLVIYSTDNGPHRNSWPDGGMTPFRSEKDTNWEGAFRIPLVVRYPGKIKAGAVSNEIVQHHDWLPTFLELAGNKTIVEDLKKGVSALGRTYKNHIDGVSLLSYLTGKTDKSPRKMFVYISDDGDTLGIRCDNWKVVFMEQRCKGTMAIWAEPFTPLRVAKLFNLRTDPYEFADITSNSYYDWFLRHAFIIYGAIALLAKFNETFLNFPKIQKPNTFTADQAIEKMHATVSGS